MGEKQLEIHVIINFSLAMKGFTNYYEALGSCSLENKIAIFFFFFFCHLAKIDHRWYKGHLQSRLSPKSLNAKLMRLHYVKMTIRK